MRTGRIWLVGSGLILALLLAGLWHVHQASWQAVRLTESVGQMDWKEMSKALAILPLDLLSGDRGSATVQQVSANLAEAGRIRSEVRGWLWGLAGMVACFYLVALVRLRRGILLPGAGLHSILLVWMVLCSLALFAAGITMPLYLRMVTQEVPVVGLVVVDVDSRNLLDVLPVLWERNQILWGLTVLFSLAMPLMKFLMLLTANLFPGPARHRVFHVAGLMGKWSMAEVFVLALLLVSLTLKGQVSLRAEPGAYVYAGHCLMAMLAGFRVSGRFPAVPEPVG